MLKKIKMIFVFTGIVFIIYGVTLTFLISPPVKFGFLLNIILYVFDFIWFICSGIFLIYCGWTINRGEDLNLTMLSFGSYFLIFSVISVITSCIFNILAKPQLESTGRIFTFLIQAFSRLLSPSLAFDFFVPLFGVLAIIAISIWFQRAVINKLKKVE